MQRNIPNIGMKTDTGGISNAFTGDSGRSWAGGLLILVCVYGINGAHGFAAGFWQLLVILFVMNLIGRFLIDGYWVGYTNAWTIPGTEDLKPYITAKDKQKKWLFGTVGMAVIAMVLAAMMTVQ